MSDDLDSLPDVRDGLSYRERVVLVCLHELQKELNVGVSAHPDGRTPFDSNDMNEANAPAQISMSSRSYQGLQGGFPVGFLIGKSYVPTLMLYGRVLEHINISQEELQAILRRWIA